MVPVVGVRRRRRLSSVIVLLCIVADFIRHHSAAAAAAAAASATDAHHQLTQLGDNDLDSDAENELLAAAKGQLFRACCS